MTHLQRKDYDFENRSKEMSAFFGNGGYLLQVIKQALDLVSATPREAVVLEHANRAIGQPSIPLVLTYHPTNTMDKTI